MAKAGVKRALSEYIIEVNISDFIVIIFILRGLFRVLPF